MIISMDYVNQVIFHLVFDTLSFPAFIVFVVFYSLPLISPSPKIFANSFI